MTEKRQNMYASVGIVQIDYTPIYKIDKLGMSQLCRLLFGIIYYAQTNMSKLVYIYH